MLDHYTRAKSVLIYFLRVRANTEGEAHDDIVGPIGFPFISQVPFLAEKTIRVDEREFWVVIRLKHACMHACICSTEKKQQRLRNNYYRIESQDGDASCSIDRYLLFNCSTLEILVRGQFSSLLQINHFPSPNPKKNI